MPHSSIFSFSHFKRFTPSLPPAFIGAIAIILTLELTVRLAPDKWLIIPDSNQGRRVYLETEIFKRFTSSPAVVVMGTSRPQVGIIPSKLDELLGLPKNSCINASLPASHPLDWLDVYRQNRSLLGHAKCVVLCLDEWSFSSGRGRDECFQLKATLADRLALVQPVQTAGPVNEPAEKKLAREQEQLDSLVTLRNQMLMDWAFNLRTKLKYIMPAILKSVGIRNKKQPPPDDTNMLLVVKNENGQPNEKKSVYIQRANEFYLHFDSHPVLIAEFEALLKMIKDDGAKIFMLHLPNRSQYQAVVEELKPLEFAQHLRVSKEIADRNGATFQAVIKASDMNVADDDFLDYGHVAMKGARAFTEWLAKTIKEKKLLEK